MFLSQKIWLNSRNRNNFPLNLENTVFSALPASYSSSLNDPLLSSLGLGEIFFKNNSHCNILEFQVPWEWAWAAWMECTEECHHRCLHPEWARMEWVEWVEWAHMEWWDQWVEWEEWAHTEEACHHMEWDRWAVWDHQCPSHSWVRRSNLWKMLNLFIYLSKNLISHVRLSSPCIIKFHLIYLHCLTVLPPIIEAEHEYQATNYTDHKEFLVFSHTLFDESNCGIRYSQLKDFHLIYWAKPDILTDLVRKWNRFRMLSKLYFCFWRSSKTLAPWASIWSIWNLIFNINLHLSISQKFTILSEYFSLSFKLSSSSNSRFTRVSWFVVNLERVIKKTIDYLF